MARGEMPSAGGNGNAKSMAKILSLYVIFI